MPLYRYGKTIELSNATLGEKEAYFRQEWDRLDIDTSAVMRRQKLEEFISILFEKHARIALAVADAESGFDCKAWSPTKDSGVFQVNIYWHPQWTRQELENCITNIFAAYQISEGGTNWYPWTTYRTGKYLKYF